MGKSSIVYKSVLALCIFGGSFIFVHKSAKPLETKVGIVLDQGHLKEVKQSAVEAVPAQVVETTPEEFLQLVSLNGETSLYQAAEALKTTKATISRHSFEDAIIDLPPGSKRSRLLEMLIATTEKDQIWSILNRLILTNLTGDLAGIVDGLAKTNAIPQQIVALVDVAKLTGQLKGLVLAEAGRRLLRDGKPFPELLLEVRTSFGSQSEDLLKYVVELHSRKNPNEVMTAIENGTIPPGAPLFDVLNTWGMEHADEVKARIFNFSVITHNGELVHTFVGGWLSQDSREASAWVASLPSGEQRKAGALAVYNFLRGHHDEASAVEWQKEL